MSTNLPQAFSFSCPLNLDTIWSKLKALGSFEWTGHDSEDYGVYIMGKPTSPDWAARVRIYGDNAPDYLLEFVYNYWQFKEGKSPDQVIAFVKDQLLPAIAASNVKQTTSYR